MSGDILDLIDNALDACDVSADAMRWTPEAPADDPAPVGFLWNAIARELPRMGEEISRLFDVPVWMVAEPPSPRSPSLTLTMVQGEFRRAYLNAEVPSGLSRETDAGSSERPTDG